MNPGRCRTKTSAGELELDSTQKELHRTVYPLRELVRSRKIDRPLTDHGVVESFHELGQMNDRKCIRDFVPLLPLRQNFTKQTRHNALRSTHFRRTHWIHCTGQ